MPFHRLAARLETMPAHSEIEGFIASTFNSVWALELLIFLRQAPELPHTVEELVTQLRASEAVVNKSIAGLVAAGLILEDDEAAIRYSPATMKLEEQVAEAEALYRTRPNTVRRVIVSGAMSGVQAFADAFRLKGD